MSALTAIADSELRVAIEQSVGGEVRAIVRRRSRYATSSTIEELEVELGGAQMLRLILKDMSRAALLTGARRAKPRFLYAPAREIDAYRMLLSGASLGTARCYGAAADERAGRFWLLLEHVPGIELYQVGELERWRLAAARLAAMHEHLAGALAAAAPPASLLVHDDRYQRRWLERARRFAPEDRGLRHLSARYEEVLALLAALPVTVIHGELYASNVLVGERDDDPRFCPVDWEMAAVGPALMDLASLVSGAWTDAERAVIAAGYRDALGVRDGWPPDQAEFTRGLDACRLQVCLQWLGWARDWQPPPENAHDWLGEAMLLTERLGL
jgi:aminoglycoside phosphotransferase (APT) family kinase protein